MAHALGGYSLHPESAVYVCFVGFMRGTTTTRLRLPPAVGDGSSSAPQWKIGLLPMVLADSTTAVLAIAFIIPAFLWLRVAAVQSDSCSTQCPPMDRTLHGINQFSNLQVFVFFRRERCLTAGLALFPLRFPRRMRLPPTRCESW